VPLPALAPDTRTAATPTNTPPQNKKPRQRRDCKGKKHKLKGDILINKTQKIAAYFKKAWRDLSRFVLLFSEKDLIAEFSICIGVTILLCRAVAQF
jgi:hypothetical protein